MNKAHEDINWQDLPIRNTPLAARNLNKMDHSIDVIDDRVIALDSGKVGSVEVTNTLQTGDTIATIKVDGTETDIKSAQVEVDSTPSATSTNPLQNKAIYEMMNNLLPEETAEGNPISINDASGLNAKACSVDLLPIQDLHGQSAPYVGGAGRNKLPYTSLDGLYGGGVTVKTNDDGSISFSGTSTETFYIVAVNFSLPQGTYTFSRGSDITSTTDLWTRIINMSTSSNILTIGNSEPSASFTLSATTNLRLAIFISSVAAISGKIYPMIEEGSTATTYEPYSNICPISGRNSVKLVRTGKNLFQHYDPSTASQLRCTLSLSGNTYTMVCSDNDAYFGAYANIGASYSAIHGTKQYAKSGMSLKIVPSDSNISKNYVVFFDKDNKCFDRGRIDLDSFTVPEGTEYFTIRLGSQNSSGNTYTFTIMVVSADETDTTYEPYQGETYTETLGQTVYGGTLDVTNGKLTIDSAKETVTAVTRNNNTSFYYVPISAPDRVFNHIISDKMKTSASYGAKGVFLNSSGAVIFATEDEYSTASAMISAFGGNIDVCFTLATPIEITLTAEQISLLKGNNVLSTDGDNINLIYSKKL